MNSVVRKFNTHHTKSYDINIYYNIAFHYLVSHTLSKFNIQYEKIETLNKIYIILFKVILYPYQIHIDFELKKVLLPPP